MDIFQLKCMVSLSQTLNFTQSALLLHISQSAFSRNISSLEKELGVTLFHRDKREVKLTPAGEIFLEEAKNILVHYEQAISMLSQEKSGKLGHLKIGILSDVTQILAPLVINNFQRLHPNVSISFSEFGHTSLMDALNRDLVDIAFISSVTPNQLTDIRWRKIQQMENAVVMHPSHTLASRESIDVKELINEKFVMVDPQESSVLYGMNTQLCMSNGFIPTNIIFAKQVPSLLFMVSCMQGIAILPSENKKFYTHELSYVPLKNKEFQINRLVAWKDVNNNPNIPIFISELDCFLASQDLLSAQECLATQQETKKQAVP